MKILVYPGNFLQDLTQNKIKLNGEIEVPKQLLDKIRKNYFCKLVTEKAIFSSQALDSVFSRSRMDHAVIVSADSFDNCDLKQLLTAHLNLKSDLTLGLNFTKKAFAKRIEIESGTYKITSINENNQNFADSYISNGIFTLGRKAAEEILNFSFNLTEFIKKEKVSGIPLPRIPEDVKDRNKLIKAAFLDRDGTINIDTGYVYKPEDLKYVPGSLDLMKWLQKRGYVLFILTNQSGIARGKFTRNQYLAFQDYLSERLKSEGINILKTYYCPYIKEGTVKEFAFESLLRKPSPGMALEAAEEFGIDLSRSLMIGDKSTDLLELPYLKSFVLKGTYEISTEIKTYADFEEIKAAIRKTGL